MNAAERETGVWTFSTFFWHSRCCSAALLLIALAGCATTPQSRIEPTQTMIDELFDIGIAVALAERCSRFEAVRADVDEMAGRWLPELRKAGYSDADLERAEFVVDRDLIARRTEAYIIENVGNPGVEANVCRAAEREMAAGNRIGSYLRRAEG